MQKNVNVFLIENSTAGNNMKSFLSQNVKIKIEKDTIENGIDGKISIAIHPSEILWSEGKAEYFKNITDIKIVSHGGINLIEGSLNTFYGSPKDSSFGVKFFILKTAV